jgi:hypothetical protein
LFTAAVLVGSSQTSLGAAIRDLAYWAWQAARLIAHQYHWMRCSLSLSGRAMFDDVELIYR